MQFDDLLRLLRTRWYVVLAITGTLVVLTWVLVPGNLPSSGRSRFQATVTLLVDSGTGTPTTTKGSAGQLATYALTATSGDVPAEVARQAGIAPGDLQAQIEVKAAADTNSLNIIAIDRTAEAASRLASLMSRELVRNLAEQSDKRRADGRGRLVSEVDKLAAEVTRLNEVAKTDPSVRGLLDSTNRQLSNQRTKLTEFENTSVVAPLSPLGAPTVRQINETPAAEKLLALPIRTLIALLLGLGSSLGVLVLADRLDVRLHTKEAVEAAFGLPVLAEVPRLPRKLRRSLVVAEAPETAFAEAHRILRTSVDVAKLAAGGGGDRAHERPLLVVVTSADPAEGKTTTASNLAASFAEAGLPTLLVGADLRHSDLSEMIPDPIWSEVVAFGPPGPPPNLLRLTTTPVPRLRLATVEPPVGRPPVVLPDLGRWLVGQRDRTGVIIVDTPPLLVCNDASELIPVADAVVVVCRVGGTTADAAERCVEVLDRLRAKVIGVVMVGAALRAPVRKVYGYGSLPQPPEAGDPVGGPGQPAASQPQPGRSTTDGEHPADVAVPVLNGASGIRPKPGGPLPPTVLPEPPEGRSPWPPSRDPSVLPIKDASTLSSRLPPKKAAPQERTLEWVRGLLKR